MGTGLGPGGLAGSVESSNCTSATRVPAPAPVPPLPTGQNPVIDLTQLWQSSVPPVIQPPTTAAQEAALGDALCAQGRHEEAVIRFGRAAQLVPGEPRYPFKLAMAAWRTSQLHWVEPNLLRALQLAPAQPAIHQALSTWYLDIGRIEPALLHGVQAMNLAPGDPGAIVSLGFVFHANGQVRQALDLIRPLLAAGLASPRLAALYGRLAPAANEESQALSLLLYVLRHAQPADADRALLHFVAADLLHRSGRFDEAFDQARLANESKRRPYHPDAFSRWVDRRLDFFTPKTLYDLPRAANSSKRPVFILGMPRSGTSLVEQVLASHPHVFGAGELSTLSRVARQAIEMDPKSGGLYPEALEGISSHAAGQLAGQYLAAIGSLNTTAMYVTDKMPLNFLYLGMIAVLFPDCHVIHCVRDPLDTCVSCYFTNFTFGHEFSNDLVHLGAFYRDYQRLMRHWTQELRYPMLEVRYEDMVNDLEGQTRRMLDYLDLPWDQRCLDFHRNPRHVATASREQVRKPVYTSSIGRWKNYEKHLGPLISAISPSPA